MTRAPRPTLVARMDATEQREKSIETRLDGVDKRLTGIEEILEQLKGPLLVLTNAKGVWWFVHQGFAILGYGAATVAAVGGAWKFVAGH